jgi:hypothetical protein
MGQVSGENVVSRTVRPSNFPVRMSLSDVQAIQMMRLHIINATMDESKNTTNGAQSPLMVEGMSALDVLLARLGLTQEQFCEELGFHRTAYQRWKVGGLVTSLNHVQAKKLDSMLRRVGLSIQDLPDDVHPYKPNKSA